MDRKAQLVSASPALPSSRFLDSPPTIFPESDVRFRWFKSNPLAENLSPDFNVAKVCSQTERLRTHPMVTSETASRIVAGSNVNGWKILKAGMDHIFGRSIVPATVHKNLNDLAVNSPSSHHLSEYSHRRTDLVNTLTRHSNKNENYYSGTKKQFSEVPTSQETSQEKCESDLKPTFVQHNAIAGALAGTCVSLCLHPIDTVKTVIQAKSFGQRSLLHTAFNITSDRGFFGLYRGLASNLASSAPISAIYTFTYETVKSSLLPHLPKEYHAIAHCTAGGFASIATSIVYTPSECVKQQMQVGSLYRNSWHAFIGILKNGGLSVLYSGWKAVLCRNVPQSIIKFYVYEGLKHYACDGNPNSASPNTWQTLLFGGIAGSTAALFTTPFDVIKTRLQTQTVGSILHQSGILNAFRCIATTEGMNGLYRGLIPRLIIYMSQGAIFFTSYEFFKHLLVVEVKRATTHDAGNPSMPHEDDVIGST